MKLDPKDFRIDTYIGSGPGGQHRNKTESAVRITHIPTNTVVCCQSERSQHRNKATAWKIMISKLVHMEREKQVQARSDARRAQIGTGGRSERIRTYNFPQQRVTDHRIGLTVRELDRILDGELDLIIEPLKEAQAKEYLTK